MCNNITTEALKQIAEWAYPKARLIKQCVTFPDEILVYFSETSCTTIDTDDLLPEVELHLIRWYREWLSKHYISKAGYDYKGTFFDAIESNTTLLEAIYRDCIKG